MKQSLLSRAVDGFIRHMDACNGAGHRLGRIVHADHLTMGIQNPIDPEGLSGKDPRIEASSQTSEDEVLLYGCLDGLPDSLFNRHCSRA